MDTTIDRYTILKRLCDLCAPSGHERAATEEMTRLLSGKCDQLTVDPLGSVLAEQFSEKKDAPTILLDAHIDEISFVITGHEQGFLKFANIGGVDPRILMANEVLVHGKTALSGIITCMPPHLSTAEEREKTPPVKDLFIDVGLTEEEAPHLVPVGSAVTLRASLSSLSYGKYAGKSLDNRAGVAAILAAYLAVREQIKSYHIKLLFSVQEEFGLHGAKAGVFHAAPDECIVVDVTHAYTSDARREETGLMGAGAMIGIAPILDREMFRTLKETAKKENIPYQVEVMNGSTGTNAFSIHNFGRGVRTGLISIPLKYMHTSVELIDDRDLASAVEILSAYLLRREEELRV